MGESPWLRIGWRNLGRNPKRSVLTALGLAVGYFACVFLVGWSEGIMAEMVENATSLVSGQIEIHDAEYRPDRSLYDTIGGRDGVDVEALLRTVDADPSVTAAAPRAYAGGLISSGEATSAGMLMGIDPQREARLSRFLETLVEGGLPRAGRNELVIGGEMARQLSVGVGDELVVVAPGADGSMANDLFTVAGLFRTGLVDFDRTFAATAIGDLQTLLVLDPARIHEIAISTADPWIAEETAARLSAAIGASDGATEVVAWTELRPEMVEYVALADTFYWVILVIVFAIALFGVANTMLMATFERRREFAVMLALGSAPRSIVLTVMCEAMAVGALSLALGAPITFLLMFWWHNAPPDLGWMYGDLTIMGALLTPSLRVEYNVPVWIWTGVALVLTTLLAAIYPAARAARIPPADTLSGL